MDLLSIIHCVSLTKGEENGYFVRVFFFFLRGVHIVHVGLELLVFRRMTLNF